MRARYDIDFTLAVEHLQRIFELNTQENFIKRSKDARAIYSTLSSQLEEMLEPIRDEANPQIIWSDKLIQLFERLESGQLLTDHTIEALLSKFELSELRDFLPENMTIGSITGFLLFFILADPKGTLPTVERETFMQELDSKETS